MFVGKVSYELKNKPSIINLLKDIDFDTHKTLEHGVVEVEKIISLNDSMSALIIRGVRYDVKNSDFKKV